MMRGLINRAFSSNVPDFRPELHPRDSEGKFIDVPDFEEVDFVKPGRMGVADLQRDSVVVIRDDNGDLQLGNVASISSKGAYVSIGEETLVIEDNDDMEIVRAVTSELRPRHEKSSIGLKDLKGWQREVEEEVDAPDVLDFDPDKHERVPLSEMDLEEGEQLATDGDTVVKIKKAVNDPTANYGPNAGYLELGDGTKATLTGDKVDVEGFMDGIESEDDVRGLVDLDGVLNPLPDPSGSRDPADWNVDWTDTINSDEHFTYERPDLVNLKDRQKQQFMREWRQAAPEEGVDEVTSILADWKAASYTENGKRYDKLAIETFELDGEPREGDFGQVKDPTAEEIDALRVFQKASKQFLRENHGDEIEDGKMTFHRGLGDHAFENVAGQVAAQYAEGEIRGAELVDNPVAIYSREKKMAHGFGTGLSVHHERDLDDVIATPEALIDMQHLGAQMNWKEGQVDLPGHGVETPAEELQVAQTGLNVREAFQNLDAFFEDSNDVDVFNAKFLAKIARESGHEGAMQKLHREFTGHPNFDEGNHVHQNIAEDLESASDVLTDAHRNIEEKLAGEMRAGEIDAFDIRTELRQQNFSEAQIEQIVENLEEMVSNEVSMHSNRLLSVFGAQGDRIATNQDYPKVDIRGQEESWLHQAREQEEQDDELQTNLGSALGAQKDE